MNQKVFKTLEYYKILEQLADFAAATETKNRIEALVPSTDIDEINHLQETTKDALSRIYEMPVKGKYLYFFRLNRFVEV